MSDSGSLGMGEIVIGNGGYRYEFRRAKHNVNHAELYQEKFGCLGCILGSVWVLIGATGSSDV